jgi:endo-1,4-beta-xylanase
VDAATTYYNNTTVQNGGYDCTLWKDYGNTSMTLNGGGTFSCSWNSIGNALFRAGKTLNSVKNYSDYGTIKLDYGCNYQPNGNSYLCVYGWSQNPLVEYYIVDSWGSWRPPGGASKGQIYVDGGTYDVYETTRYSQPSIEGTKTFKQYWSVRTSKRTSGTITVSEHFRAWANKGMYLGKLYEVALNVEGYQSSGNANVYKNNLTFGGSSSGNSGNNNSGSQNNSGNSNQGTIVQCENMTLGGSYAGKISNPFNGVALYANNDSVSYNQYFGYGTHNFSLRACSNNSNMAKIDLYIGGAKKGTFYYGGSYPATYTIKNVSHGTGSQQVKLVVTSDDGTWDGYLDYLQIN